MESLSEAEARALDAQCGSPTSTHSRRAVVRLAALPPDDKVHCLVNFVESDFGNLVRCAVAAGVSADTLWGEDKTPVLCVAAQCGSMRALRALLAGGAHPDSADVVGLSAAHFAAGCGHTTCLRLLVETGAPLEARASDGSTPLIFAAHKGHAEACQLLLSAGASADVCMPRQDTPLHAAAEKGHATVINVLAAAGAELDARNNDGRTLSIAAFQGHAEAVAALLAHGADQDAVNALGIPRWWERYLKRS